MPQPERSLLDTAVKNSGVRSDTSIEENNSAGYKPEPRLPESHSRMSVTEAGKHLINRISLSLSRSAQFDQLIDEEEESNFENDDVFC